MKKNLGIGIGIGVGIVAVIASIVMPYNSQTSDARFAQLDAFYDEYDDKTTVILYLTNNDGNYVKATGTATITLCHAPLFEDVLTDCFSNGFTFTKGGFYTWTDNSGRKITGHQFVINQELLGEFSWDASIDITLEDGTAWVDVDTTFFAVED